MAGLEGRCFLITGGFSQILNPPLPVPGPGSVVVSPPEEVGSSPEEVEEEDSGVLEEVGVLLMVAGSRPKDW